MSKVLVSASHFDTLCQDAWKLFEDNGIDVVFDLSLIHISEPTRP